MSPALLAQTENIREHVHKDPSVSLTDFARGKRWREELPECGVIEIIDRTETAGYLLSEESMQALLDTIDSLEEELERATINAMFEARADYDNPTSGDELVAKALESFETRKDQLEEITKGNRQ